MLTGLPVLFNVVGMVNAFNHVLYLGDPVLCAANVPICKLLSELRDLIALALIRVPSVFVFSADIHFITGEAVVLVIDGPSRNDGISFDLFKPNYSILHELDAIVLL